VAEHPSRAALAVVLGLAALGQVRVWATGRGLWGDELAIAINLQERAFTELAGTLTYFQVAPVGWLVTGKVILLGIGEDERALRLPSLAAGLVTLALVAMIADRAIGRWAAVAAVGLVGATPAVLYYAGELKQYSVETAVGLALVVVGAALTRRDATAVRWPVLAADAAFAVVAVTLSCSALVVLAGVAGGVVVYLAAQRRWWAALAGVAVVAPAGRRRDLQHRRPATGVRRLLQAAGDPDRFRELRCPQRLPAPGARPGHHGPGVVPGRHLGGRLHGPGKPGGDRLLRPRSGRRAAQPRW
jgi:hypothetical protein